MTLRYSLKMAMIAALTLGATAVAATEVKADGWRRFFDPGLSYKARWELRKAGLTKYLGKYKPFASAPFANAPEWTKHDFDPDGGHGPVCIDGSDFSVFTRKGDPKKLLIFMQGGGACWEGLPQCNIKAAAQYPLQYPEPRDAPIGIFSQSNVDGSIENAIGDWSVLYMPYCDGSVWSGDNEVADPTFTNAFYQGVLGQNIDLTEEGVRRHRGLRNLSAGMDVAKKVFPRAKKILVTGSSAGGVGTAAWAPFLTRFKYGDRVRLYAFNDAGPIVGAPPERAAVSYAARANDWGFAQFYPKSCKEQGLCDAMGQSTGIVRWRLQNDRDILESFYSADSDLTNLGFVNVNDATQIPFGGADALVSPPIAQAEYRALLDAEHGALNAAFPRRYKRFIVSGANPACAGRAVFTHTALRGQVFGPCPEGTDYFYELVSQKTGVPLVDFVNDFVNARGKRWRDRFKSPAWVDSVEDFSPPMAPPTLP